jgi:hypothetical protein
LTVINAAASAGAVTSSFGQAGSRSRGSIVPTSTSTVASLRSDARRGSTALATATRIASLVSAAIAADASGAASMVAKRPAVTGLTEIDWPGLGICIFPLR